MLRRHETDRLLLEWRTSELPPCRQASVLAMCLDNKKGNDENSF